MRNDQPLKTESEKAEALLKGVLEKFPGATATDVEKNTPMGKQITDLLVESARKLAAQTGDTAWRKIAQTFQGRQIKGKPAPELESKYGIHRS